jgi:HTH-type transcriptional regulator / antitoxin HipB
MKFKRQNQSMIHEDSFFNDLSKIIIYHRKSSGLTRLELARLAGVGKTVVYDIEHAKQTLRLDTAIKILNVLNISVELKSPLMQTYREMNHEKS